MLKYLNGLSLLCSYRDILVWVWVYTLYIAYNSCYKQKLNKTLICVKYKKLAITLVVLWIGNRFQNVIFVSPPHTVVACTTCKNTIQYQFGQNAENQLVQACRDGNMVQTDVNTPATAKLAIEVWNKYHHWFDFSRAPIKH